MRVERIHVGGFGRLTEVDTGPEPLPGLVTVLGPNEVGKSTLFHLLTSLLYGFYPASRDGNPYAPWDGSDPAGAMTLRLDGGGCVEVERRLLGQPSGRMTVGGRVEELRNRTLPWAEHVPRAVFLQVFALTLEELAGLEEETWARIQDRIVGAMGATDVLPARQVVSELEQAAGELWRPNRRGNQRIRDIQRAILELRERRRSAGERDRGLRDMAAELEGVRDQLKVARRDRSAAQVAVERVQALIPIRNQLLRIAALRQDAGPPHALAGLPADPAAELAARRRRARELATRLRETRAERAEPQAAVAAFDDGERRILARQADISALLARAAAMRSDRTRLAGLEQEIRDLQRRLEAQSAHLLDRGWSAEMEEPVAALPMAEVGERVRRTRSAAEQLRILQAAAQREEPEKPRPAPPMKPTGSLAILVAGILLLAFGATGGGVLAT
ncbi:MAG TPA: AAA family ATPase, partial [Longimicrobiales bacterium]|nr:AAA family ATPase [Longimicrobiales bacterium]